MGNRSRPRRSSRTAISTAVVRETTLPAPVGNGGRSILQTPKKEEAPAPPPARRPRATAIKKRSTGGPGAALRNLRLLNRLTF